MILIMILLKVYMNKVQLRYVLGYLFRDPTIFAYENIVRLTVCDKVCREIQINIRML